MTPSSRPAALGPAAAALVFFALLALPAQAQEDAAQPPFDYPETRTVDTVDVYHGTRVADPYRWMEDVSSDAVAGWVEEQNDLSFSYLDALPERAPVRERLTELWNYPKYGVPLKRGSHYFYAQNSGLQNQSVWYQQDELGAEAEPEVLIDPNELSEDGTVALSTLSFSDDGGHVVYGTSRAGSDWRTFRVRNTQTGEDLDDELEWIKFSGASWGPEGEGFYYGRYEAPEEGETYEAQNKGQQLYFHRLGTPQSADRLVYARPDQPEWGFSPTVTDDDRYLVVSVWKGTDRRNQLFYKDLQGEGDDNEMRELIDTFEAAYQFVGNEGPVFYFLTDLDAPNKRLVAIDTREPARENWRTLIPEREGVVLQSAEIIGGRFVVEALDDVKARLTLHTLDDGALQREIELPAIGSVGGVTGARDGDEMFYSFTSYTYPRTIFHYDFAEQQPEVFRQPDVPDFAPERYETKQVFYESRDGTRVPMFIVHKKGLEMDGTNPTYLYGYGGFNVSLTPGFSTSNLVWLEQGGIYAVPNLRGGGEYGEAWHQAGMLENKQNVFDDFAWAARHLIEEGYTSPEKLAIGGGSNGGLLTGASLTQRPELFGAVVVRVGVLDMLRYHTFTIGWAWASEYGTSDDPEQFETLYAYSPLHNVDPDAEYPPTLIMTADTDDRVVPAHSYKFTATLQDAQPPTAAPVLLRVETDAGHGAGTPTSKIIQGAADRWAFLFHTLDVETDFAPAETTGEAAPERTGER